MDPVAPIVALKSSRSHFRYSGSHSLERRSLGRVDPRWVNVESSSRIAPEDTDDGIGTAKSATNSALLRVAVRREEGGQVESWVSESVGGAEHA